MADVEKSEVEISPKLLELFKDVEKKFTETALGPERWYLPVLAAIVGGGEPTAASSLYLYLIESRPSPSSRQALVRRLRETLVKSVSIYGVCRPIEAILSINKVERDEDKDRSCTRQGWMSSGEEENRQRGRAWLAKVYKGNLDATLDLFRDHRDFAWLSEHITYGLYLADRQVLDDVDTELVVLAGIMIQNLPTESRWHIRGCRRIGITDPDLRVVWDSVQLVARFLDLKLTRIPAPEQVEVEV